MEGGRGGGRGAEGGKGVRVGEAEEQNRGLHGA
jgi:hypothetical protein